MFDVFEAFINTDNIQVFANAATDYIMCLMKFVKGLGLSHLCVRAIFHFKILLFKPFGILSFPGSGYVFISLLDAHNMNAHFVFTSQFNTSGERIYASANAACFSFLQKFKI